MISSRLITISVLTFFCHLTISSAGDTEIWPIPTECPRENPLDYTVHLQHESDCTKFYKCDHGNKVEFDCPPGLHFNKVLQVCDWPVSAGCEGENVKPTTTAKPTTQKPTTVKPTTQKPTTPKPTTAKPTTAKPTPPPNKDPECPWPDSLDYTVHLPHENDCSKFYKCDNGVKVEFDCPDGLHFNKELEVCDWPQDAGCEKVTPKPTTVKPTTEKPTTPKPTTAKPTTAKPTPPPNRDPECPWPDPLDYTVHLPHENDCSKFYKCDNGVKVEFDCPDGLHFNKELEVCDWPQDAGCEKITPKPTTAKPTTQKPTTVKPTTQKPTTPKPTTTKPTTAKPTPPPNRDPECPWPDPLDYTVHLPHENDCSKFYKCDNGVKVEFDCPDGLHFNKELEVCDWPQDAGCEKVTPKPTTVKPTTEKPTTPKPTTAKPTTAKPTPPPNRDPECPWPDPLDYTVHLPHENDCSKFYKCDNGVKVEFDCPDGLHFNKELEVCDWPQDAGCEKVTPKPTTAKPTTQKPTTVKPTTQKPTTPKPTTAKPTTAKPTPPPNRDPECPWPDPLDYTVHLPHENDCSKFYKCDNGVKVEFDCPDGLHFNKELEVCDWPQDAGCEKITPKPTTAKPTTQKPTTVKPTTQKPTTPKPTTTKPTTAKPTPPPNRDPECPWPDPLDYTVHLPHENDCSKFYKCDNGVKVEFDCPDGLHFNKELEVCDWPQDAGCEKITPKPTTAKPTTQKPTTVKPTTQKPTTPKPTTTKPTTAKPTPPPNRDPECPWPDPLDYTVHLPHENDCSKFYKCDNGVKVEFDCPDGLHFNKELEVCDWPQDAGCEKVTPKPTTAKPTTQKPTTPKPTTAKPTTAKPTPPPNKDPECPWPDPLNYTVHLPHENDCSKFYKCDNGVKVEFDCPPGLHFNKELEVCDWPKDAGCEKITPKPTTVEPTTTKPTPPPNRDPGCPWPDSLNHTVHLPHECDCNKFYKCDNGVKVELDCPPGLHFNKELEICDWPENAGCEKETPKPTIPVPTPEPTTSKPTPPPNRDPECPWPDPLNYTVHLPHENDCGKFYKCDNGVKIEFDCPAGLHFNKELEVCDWPKDAGCEKETPKPTTPKPTTPEPTTTKPTPPPNRDPECPWPDPLNYTVHLPHEDDCSKFYKCDNGVKVEFDCPSDLHFNKEKEVCDWPKDAGCEETTPEPTTAKPTTQKPTLPPNRDPECPWPDPLNYTVHLPHESDCGKFYKCDNGVKVEFDCPSGLHFNKVLEVCDWPKDAGCEEPTPEPTTAKPTTQTPTPSPQPPPTECPLTNCQDSTIYIPVLGNPHKYIRCVNGEEKLETCPSQLLFDKNLRTCNLEHQIEP